MSKLIESWTSCYGTKYYCLPIDDTFNVILHREDGPAIEWADGSKSWRYLDIPHRIDGPAYIDIKGYVEWYVNGKCITLEVEKWIKETNLPHYSKWNNQHKVLFKLTWG